MSQSSMRWCDRCERWIVPSYESTVVRCPYCFNDLTIEKAPSVDQVIIPGWQCPICKRIYSPYTEKCSYCGPEQESNAVLNVIDTSNFDNQYAGTVRRKLGGNWEESEYGRWRTD